MSSCDLPEFYEWSEPVARKEHRCCECNAPINKGEKHFHARGKWDGAMSSFRQHMLCLEACMFIRDKLNGGDCICFGGLFEWWDDSKSECDKTHFCWRQIRQKLAGIKRRERQIKKENA